MERTANKQKLMQDLTGLLVCGFGVGGAGGEESNVGGSVDRYGIDSEAGLLGYFHSNLPTPLRTESNAIQMFLNPQEPCHMGGQAHAWRAFLFCVDTHSGQTHAAQRLHLLAARRREGNWHVIAFFANS